MFGNWKTSRSKGNNHTWVQHAQKVKYGLFQKQVHSGQILNMRFYACSGYLVVKNERTMPWTMSSMAFFKNQGQITPKWQVWSCENLNLSWDLTPVLVTCKFDKNQISNECASMETSFSHYSLWEVFLVLKGTCNTEVDDPIWLEFQLVWNFMPVGYLQVWRRSDKKWIVFGCHDNHSFNPICPKT